MSAAGARAERLLLRSLLRSARELDRHPWARSFLFEERALWKHGLNLDMLRGERPLRDLVKAQVRLRAAESDRKRVVDEGFEALRAFNRCSYQALLEGRRTPIRTMEDVEDLVFPIDEELDRELRGDFAEDEEGDDGEDRHESAQRELERALDIEDGGVPGDEADERADEGLGGVLQLVEQALDHDRHAASAKSASAASHLSSASAPGLQEASAAARVPASPEALAEAALAAAAAATAPSQAVPASTLMSDSMPLSPNLPASPEFALGSMALGTSNGPLLGASAHRPAPTREFWYSQLVRDRKEEKDMSFEHLARRVLFKVDRHLRHNLHLRVAPDRVREIERRFSIILSGPEPLPLTSRDHSVISHINEQLSHAEAKDGLLTASLLVRPYQELLDRLEERRRATDLLNDLPLLHPNDYTVADLYVLMWRAWRRESVVTSLSFYFLAKVGSARHLLLPLSLSVARECSHKVLRSSRACSPFARWCASPAPSRPRPFRRRSPCWLLRTRGCCKRRPLSASKCRSQTRTRSCFSTMHCRPAASSVAPRLWHLRSLTRCGRQRCVFSSL
jgi:hypothetical protein